MRARETMSNKNAAKIAALLSVDLAEVIAACEVGKNPSDSAFWSRWVAVFAIVSVGIYSQYGGLTEAYAFFSVLPPIYYAHIACALLLSLIVWIGNIGSDAIA